MHASTFAHDEIAGRLLEFAAELEARAESLMSGDLSGGAVNPD